MLSIFFGGSDSPPISAVGLALLVFGSCYYALVAYEWLFLGPSIRDSKKDIKGGIKRDKEG